jgi:hypothetical protein
MAQIVITTGGGIATHNIFAIYFRGNRYMLANRETEDVTCMWKSEAISMILVNMTVELVA